MKIGSNWLCSDPNEIEATLDTAEVVDMQRPQMQRLKDALFEDNEE